MGLAALALGGAGTVIFGQFGRMLRRRAHLHRDGEGLIETAPAAALDTVGVAVRGYAATPRSETVLFNLLAGFLGSFALVRLSTWGVRDEWGPFRNHQLRRPPHPPLRARHLAHLCLRHGRADDR